MGKISALELASILAAKHGISKKEAQNFVNAVVAVIKDGVEADRLVKVKGLGTFKVVDVEARQSVSVRNGERLTIEGHSKLTFLPDKEMKEMVNKPFSMFETVILNDGVDFDEMTPAAAEEATPDDEEQKEIQAATVQEEKPVTVIPEEAPMTDIPEETTEEDTAVEEVSEQQVPEMPTVEEEAEHEPEAEPVAETVQPMPILEIADEPQTETETMSITEQPFEHSDDENGDEEDVYDNNTSKRWWVWVATLVVLAAIGVAVWWFLLRKPATDNARNEAPAQTESANQAAAGIVEADDSLTADYIDGNMQPADTIVTDPEYYNQQDNRVRLGAYDIVGLDTVITARRGDTPRRIARRVFGGEQMSCYIETFNGLTGNTALEEGTEVKIPKIKTKQRNKTND